ISPLLILDYANQNYDQGHTPHSPNAIAAFGRYCGAVVSQFPEIREVEIWNEYNGAFCDGPATSDRARYYSDLLKSSYGAIKAQRPTVTVVGADTVGVPLPYLKKLITHGAFDAMDAISVHPYRYEEAPEGIETDIHDLRALLQQSHHELPIWVTEIGWYLKAAKAAGDLAIDEGTQAKFLVRAYGLLLSEHVARIYWYDLKDNPSEPPLGLLDEKGRPRMAARAYATLIQKLHGFDFIEREKSVSSFYSLVFRSATGATLRLVWSTQVQEIHVDPSASVIGILGEPLAQHGVVSISDTPVYIENSAKLSGVPPPEIVFADSRRDFSDAPDAHGWKYGYMDQGTFKTLTRYAEDDWNGAWLIAGATQGNYAHLAVTAHSQNPSAAQHHPIPVVRRWVSDHAGRVHISAKFACPASIGDGVTVTILGAGRILYQLHHLGGKQPTALSGQFECDLNVNPGTFIDFVVGPGISGNFDYDDTAIYIRITDTAAAAITP
ncbi:MAG TPA: glycosyl hydrolase, partial [Opitutaceae bacterium]